MKRNKLTILALLAFSILHSPFSITFAATGCTYPTSLDAFTDKIAGDQLTVSLLNQMMCDLEKLQSGVLRPNDGSAGAPAYAFRTSATAGMFLSGADTIDFSTASTARWRISSSGHLLGVTDNSFDIGAAGATRPRSIFLGSNAVIGGSIFMGHSVSTGSSSGDILVNNTKALRFLNAAGTTSADFEIIGNSSNNMTFGVPAATNIYAFKFAASDRLEIVNEFSGGGIKFMSEASSDHSAPSANQAVIYAKDNGAGKTQLCAIFSSGAAQCFATQP